MKKQQTKVEYLATLPIKIIREILFLIKNIDNPKIIKIKNFIKSYIENYIPKYLFLKKNI